MRRFLVATLYWGVVLVISLALVVALLLFLEARDASQLERSGSGPGAPASPEPGS